MARLLWVGVATWTLAPPVRALAPLQVNLEGLQEKAGEDPFITYYPDEPQHTAHYCTALESPENKKCTAQVKWAFSQTNSSSKKAKDFLDEVRFNMRKYGNVAPENATLDDFQKLYWCAPPKGNLSQECGAPPCNCTYPPCHMCLFPERPRNCTAESKDIRCKPPKQAMDYNGMQWPLVKVATPPPYHIFAIGDWGGMDTMLKPVQGRDPLMPWWGYGLPKPGPTPFPRTRWNKNHDFMMCNHEQFLNCYKTWGTWGCPAGCGFDKQVDTQPQQLVAKVFKKRAEQNRPVAILNVGDNFYWGGIEKDCGHPMDELSYTAAHQFDQIFESVYNGPGVDGVPWISCLGNHDWGGRRFNNGWDQQFAYTWKSNRWILPAAYYTLKMYFEVGNFWMDIYVVDSNNEDGKDQWQEPSHNICGNQHNPWGATCASAGGPADVNSCHQWFWDLWGKQSGWLASLLAQSTAQWQVAVTHFPCGTQKNFWMDMHNRLGLDLLVTGHRHDQELWEPGWLGGLTCFITGGGGGISSEGTPNPYWKRDWYGEAQYGFYDLLVSFQNIVITSVDWSGYELKTSTVWPTLGWQKQR